MVCFWMGYPKTHPDLSVKNGLKLKISSFAAHTKHELSSSHLRGFVVIIHVHGGVRGDLGTNFQLKLGFCPIRISWLICQQGESLEWQRVPSVVLSALPAFYRTQVSGVRSMGPGVCLSLHPRLWLRLC